MLPCIGLVRAAEGEMEDTGAIGDTGNNSGRLMPGVYWALYYSYSQTLGQVIFPSLSWGENYVKLNLVAPSSVLEAHYEPTDCPTALPEDRVLGSG